MWLTESAGIQELINTILGTRTIMTGSVKSDFIPGGTKFWNRTLNVWIRNIEPRECFNKIGNGHKLIAELLTGHFPFRGHHKEDPKD